MSDQTIVTNSPVGQHLDSIGETKAASYLMFNNKKVSLVAKITIGRDTDNDVIVDNKLASRHHALIQKIKDAYFIKDVGSTNGTFINGAKIPADKYVKLIPGDKITIGNTSLVIS
ncbi:MAG: FHA domain-containing protein [Treponema sp.]|nr:FHA domain-containing protein [Spirochaetia bacterium]MDY2839835.1 FHA domain-containing protein [Treponema sp.]MDY5123741.1 FHA domain-containing protein [Treponema sp.]